MLIRERRFAGGELREVLLAHSPFGNCEEATFGPGRDPTPHSQKAKQKPAAATKDKVKTINLEMQRKRREQRSLGHCREIGGNLSGRRKSLANVTTPKDLCFLRFLCISRFMVLTLSFGCGCVAQWF